MNTYRIGLTSLMTLALLLAFAACEKSDLYQIFEGPYFVRFTDTTLTYKESYSPPISIRVHNAGPQLNEPITVNYTVSGAAREGKDYSIVGTKGTVTIPAKSSFGTIQLKLINNANNVLDNQTLIFTLTSVQPSSLQVGFGPKGLLGRTLRFTIQDDCLLGGAYTAVRQTGTYVSLLGITPSTATLSNIAVNSTDCKTYTVTNWNVGLSSIFGLHAVKPPFTFVDNGDNSLTIPNQTNTELPGDTLSGTGAWNPQNRQLSFNLRWKSVFTTRAGKDTTLTITFPFTSTPQ